MKKKIGYGSKFSDELTRKLRYMRMPLEVERLQSKFNGKKYY